MRVRREPLLSRPRGTSVLSSTQVLETGGRFAFATRRRERKGGTGNTSDLGYRSPYNQEGPHHGRGQYAEQQRTPISWFRSGPGFASHQGRILAASRHATLFLQLRRSNLLTAAVGTFELSLAERFPPKLWFAGTLDAERGAM